MSKSEDVITTFAIRIIEITADSDVVDTYGIAKKLDILIVRGGTLIDRSARRLLSLIKLLSILWHVNNEFIHLRLSKLNS